MKITYIVGNGFDINLGLNTRYTDFYKWYTSQPSMDKDPDVVRQFKNEINIYLAKKNKEINWSDLELALGQYSKEVPSELFRTLYMDVAAKLKEFLTEEYACFDKTLYDSNKFIFYLENPISGHFNEARTRKLQSFASSHNFENEINIINFNYTNTIEDLLGGYQNAGGWRGLDGNYVTLKPIAHVHHSLIEGNIVFGVNDVSQIANPNYKENPGIQDLFIKPTANNILGGYSHYAAESIIQETNLFVLFGVSVGATDRKWWNLIGKRLSSSLDARMIWFIHDNTINEAFSDFLYKDVERKVVPRFKSMTGLPTIESGNMDNRIFVTLSNKMFCNLQIS